MVDITVFTCNYKNMRINLHNLNIICAPWANAFSAPLMFTPVYNTQKLSGTAVVPASVRQVGYMTKTPFLKNIHI